MDEPRRVARNVTPELQAIAIFEAKRVRLFISTRKRSQDGEMANPPQVRKYVEQNPTVYAKRDSRQTERILDHDAPPNVPHLAARPRDNVLAEASALSSEVDIETVGAFPLTIELEQRNPSKRGKREIGRELSACFGEESVVFQRRRDPQLQFEHDRDDHDECRRDEQQPKPTVAENEKHQVEPLVTEAEQRDRSHGSEKHA